MTKHTRYNRSEKGRARAKRRYERRKAAGICANCGGGPVITEVLCWSCLSAIEERRVLAFG